MIPALVLTAGLATRLRPLSLVRAKAALPVAGQPLARRILRSLAAAGVTDAVLNLHHLPHTLTACVGDGADLGLRVRYSWEAPAVLGSAGGVRRALSLLGTPRFLILNGDTLTDADVVALLARHADTGALVTMAVIPNVEPDKYGGVLVDGNGIVTGFVARGSRERSYHFIGLQAAEATAFATLPDNTPYESVTGLYPALMRDAPGSVRALVVQAQFLDIGTPADYMAASRRLSAIEGLDRDAGRSTRIAPDARVEGSVLWDDVEVGPGASLRECIVTDRVHVPPGTSWQGVSMRLADGALAPGETQIGRLAVVPIRSHDSP